MKGAKAKDSAAKQAAWDMLPEIQQAQLLTMSPEVRKWREQQGREQRRCNQCRHYRPLGAGSGTCFKGVVEGAIYPSGFSNWAPKCPKFEE